MPKPIYSRRYSREDEVILALTPEAEAREYAERLPDMPRGSTWRDRLYGKAVEVTHLNRYDVDIYEGTGTMMVKVFLYCPRVITGLAELVGMADVLSIDKEKEGYDIILSMLYDIDAK